MSSEYEYYCYSEIKPHNNNSDSSPGKLIVQCNVRKAPPERMSNTVLPLKGDMRPEKIIQLDACNRLISQ